MTGRGPAGRWAFIHVPKTGGTSVSHALPGPPMDTRFGQHAPVFEVMLKERFEFTFGFVRNPWDRLASLYQFMKWPNFKQHRERPWYDVARVRKMGFKRWLLEGRTWTPEDVELKRDRAAPPMQRRPQSWWLEGATFVGRYEDLQADYKIACARIGALPQRLTIVNARPRAPYQELYDEEMTAAVAQWFAQDIQEWEYAF